MTLEDLAILLVNITHSASYRCDQTVPYRKRLCAWNAPRHTFQKYPVRISVRIPAVL